MEYGLIGGRLGHSYSKPIHEELGGYDYRLCPLPTPEEAHAFLRARDFKAINVTIPYKELVLPYCDEIDDAARAIGSVNTLVNKNGRLEGHNTDFAGFTWMLRKNGICLKNKTVMLLGTGGTQKTALAVARAEGAAEVILVSRRHSEKAISYEEAAARRDVQVLVNTSPVGMYPENGACLAEREHNPTLEAVRDVLYNPFRTELRLRAEARGLPAVNGMGMLVAQAKYAAEYFTGKQIPDAEIGRIDKALRRRLSNLVLIGMPGCGKTSIGKRCAQLLGKRFVDMDDVLVERIGGPISGILSPGSEKPFRYLESAAERDLGKENGQVIATGGGVVLREENIRALRQNGVIVYLSRPLKALALGGGRPLSQSAEAVARLYETRAPLYAAACEARVENTGTADEAARAVKEKFDEIFGFERAEPESARRAGTGAVRHADV